MLRSGQTNRHCQAGCQSAYGICRHSHSSSSRSPLTHRVTSTRTFLVVPSSTQQISTNARCGVHHGAMTCLGSRQYGECCSQFGYCGSSAMYCGTGCQAGFGKCSGRSLSSVKSSKIFSASSPKPTQQSATSSFSSLQTSSNFVNPSTVTSSLSSSASSTSASSSPLSALSTRSIIPSTSGISSSDTLPSTSFPTPSATYCRASCRMVLILCSMSFVLAAFVLIDRLNSCLSLGVFVQTKNNVIGVAGGKGAV